MWGDEFMFDNHELLEPFLRKVGRVSPGLRKMLVADYYAKELHGLGQHEPSGRAQTSSPAQAASTWWNAQGDSICGR
jgi:hypothetical protein